MSQKSMRLSEIFPFPTYEEWKAAAEEALGGVPFEKKLITKTYEGIDLQPIYSKEETKKLEFMLENLPGEYPFLRSNDRLGFKKEYWEIAQEIACPTPELFNKALLSDLERGQNSVVIAPNEDFAIAPKNYKSDNSQKTLMISSAADIEAALKNVDFRCVSLRVKSNSLGLELAALVWAYLKKQNIDPKEVRLSFGVSPLNELKTKGKPNVSISKLIDDAEQLIKWKKSVGSKARIVSVNAEVFLNGGSSSVQDVAFAIAEGTYLVRELLHRGLEIDDIAQSINFEFAVGPKFFTEISKFRAARILWAKIIKEFGGNEESQKMIINASTSKINKTKFDPNVNMLRGTTEALSAVLGGCQSLNVGAYDEELGISGEFSRRISRNIQSVIMYEAHIADTIDPASGSWYLEVLTNQIAQKAWDLFREVETKGGMLEALKAGFIQDEIAKTAASRKSNIASRRDTLLGTNKYPNLTEKPVETLLNIDSKEVNDFVAKYTSKCTNSKCESAVNEYRKVFLSDRSKSFEKAVNAFAECTTIAELLEVTGIVGTDTISVKAILPYRMGEIFEEMRQSTQAASAKDVNSTKICLVNFGQLKEFKGRNDFSSDFFQVAGLEMVNTDGAMDADAGIEQVKSTDFKVYVICSTDDRYATIVPDFAKKLKEIKPNAKLILAGYPAELIESFKVVGVDDFIHIKTNIYDFLSGLMKEIGILN